MSPVLQRLFREYADAHRHPTNRLTHKIAIPLIVFHVVAMSDWVPLFTLPGADLTVTLAMLGSLAACGWYLAMSLKIGATTALGIALCFPIARATPPSAVIAIAVVGWIIQLLGHAVWEKNRPAFFTNLIQTLVGPAFFVAVFLGDWPLRAPSPSELRAGS